MNAARLMCGLAVGALTAGSAWAQQASPPPATPDTEAGIGDIVVTATRRDEALQKVPIAVTAIGGEQLAKSGVGKTTELTQTMPALNFTRVNNNMQPTIRGVGTRDTSSGNEANVSIYVDGIYQVDQTAGAFDLANIQRIEVLRGPQGTLFGRNATGGLINVVTTDPSHTFGGTVKLSYGRFNDFTGQVYITGALSEKIAVDLTATANRADGYVLNLLTNRKVGDRKSYSGRARVMLEPTDNFTIKLSASKAYASDPTIALKQTLNGSTAARSLANNPNVLIPTKPYQTALSIDPLVRTTSDQLNGEVKWDLGAVTLVDTASYQHVATDSILDQDATPFDLGYTVGYNRGGKYYLNELRLLSNSSGPIDYIAGLFYINGDGYEPKAGGTTIVNRGGLTTTIIRSNQHIESASGFGEATWRFAEGWKVIGGLRYTTERRHMTGQTFSRNNVTVITTALTPYFDKTAKFSKLTYRGIVQREVGSLGNVYASYSRGFKSGSFNTYSTSPAQVATKPEILDSFEAGFKADPTPWLRINLSAFHYKYKDIQLASRDPVTNLTATFNGGAARMNGGELEVTARPMRHLNLRGYATYLDAKFTSLATPQIFVTNFQDQRAIGGSQFTPIGNASFTNIDQAGKRLIRSPEYTFGGSADYTIETTSGDINYNLNVYRSGKYFWDVNNRTSQPAYWLLNSELAWTLPHAGPRLAVWVKNLTNALVAQQISPSSLDDGVSYERPRTYGVSMSVTF